MEVDFDSYIYELEKERKRGRKRAATRNFLSPVSARARVTKETISG
jgi:hypothetical protein